ncbi:solute carrier family 2, facilitated glucose transporter member 8-like isoform X2 [Dermacentor albipictus]|uniref:solute carrier family 2, facilitated glucose transporter member 8-like isoform X2 n=1 Tax=Dermacentor albipictus TaxID=60249 RepID=UPI0031FE1E3E
MAASASSLRPAVVPVASQAAPPARKSGETAELQTNALGPMTLFSSLMAGWMGSVSMGASMGYSLPAVQSLRQTRSNQTRNGDHQLFWLDSLLPLAAVFGSMWGCCLAFWLGRRRAMAIGCLGSLCAWLSLGWTSTDSWNLYTARFLIGAASGVVSLIAPAYAAEIAPPNDRGKQCGTVHTGIAAGVLYAYLVGRFTDWSLLALWCAIPSALAALLAVWAVESPRWLMEQDKHDEAQAALRRLRFVISQADGELQAIEVIYVKSPTRVRHYILAVMMIVLQQFSGVNMIMHYATGPLRTSSTSTSRDFYIMLASVQLVTTLLASQLLDMVGRVKPLAVSVTVCTCSMVALGSAFFAYSTPDGSLDSALGHDITSACKVVFAIGYSIGLGPATWVLAIELAPLRGRGFDFGSVCVFHWASALTVISLVSAFGPSATWLAVLACLASGATFAGGVAAFFILPDTSNVSLEVILLEGRKDRPKKPPPPAEFSGSSTTQLQKDQKEHERKQREAAAFGHASLKPKATVPTGRQTLRALSDTEHNRSSAHKFRNDENGEEEPKKSVRLLKNEAGGTLMLDKVMGATALSKLERTLLPEEQLQWER